MLAKVGAPAAAETVTGGCDRPGAAAVRQITMANRIGMTRRSFIVFPPYFPWSFGWFSGNFQPFQHICINLFFLRQAKKLERLKNNLSGKNPGCKSCIRGSLVIEL
jgi:hypothetical protein